jgi:hypothetical protein
MGSETIEFTESRLEGKFQLEINREKTRVVDLREEGASLDFLGYTFRYDRDLKGRDRKYLNVFPSTKTVQRERDARRTMASAFGALGADPSIGHCACLRRELSGEPDAGNLHLPFDEGRGTFSVL